MSHAATQKATFTGTLLRREHTLGQKVVRLIFRDADKDWLCLSSNLTNIKLEVGQQYHIRGMLRSLGDRTYVHEPRIALIGSRVASLRRLGLGVGIVLLVATLTVLAMRVVHGTLASTSAETFMPAPSIRSATAPLPGADL